MKFQSSCRVVSNLSVGLGLALFACGGEGVTRPELPSTTTDAGPDATSLSDALPVADASIPAEVVTLTIDAPVAGQWVNSRRLYVSGTYTGSPEAITVDGQPATLTEGTYSATVDAEPGPKTITVAAGEVTATVDVNVDPVPPAITLTAPLRGVWSEDATIPTAFEVTDESGLTGVYLNERRLPGGGPGFTVDAPLATGLNILSVRADDLAGNTARESTAVLAGPTRDPEVPIDGAFRVHLGPRALRGVGAEAARYIDDLDLRALLPEAPIEAAGFIITIDDVRHAHTTTVAMTPEPFQLRAQLHVENVEVDVSITINEVPYPVTLHAAALDVTGLLSPGVFDGEIRTGVSDLMLDLVDFGVDLTGVPSFGGQAGGEENLLEQFVEEAAHNLANELVPGLLDTALAEFDKVFDTTLMGVALRITVVPEELLVREDGLSLKAGAGVILISPPAAAPVAPGYPGRISGWDGVPDGEDLSVAIDDDLINLLLFQFWQSGVGLPVIDQAFITGHPDLGEQIASIIAFLGETAFPDLAAGTPLRITSLFSLPPVVHVIQAPEGGAGLTVGVGDLGLAIDTDNGQRRRLLDGAASLVLEASLSIAPNAQGTPGFQVEVSRSTTAFDVLTESLRGEVEAAVEAPMTTILGALGYSLPGLVSGVPVPSFGALPVSGFQVRVEPSAPDFLRVDAEIGATP
jgi:hypothetical protein